MRHVDEKRDCPAGLTRREIGVGCCQCELLREPARYGVATEACSWLKLSHNGGGTVGHHREPYLRQQLGSRQQWVTLVRAKADRMIQPLLGLLDLAPLCVYQDGGELGEPDAYFSGVRSASGQHGGCVPHGAPQVPAECIEPGQPSCTVRADQLLDAGLVEAL